MAPYDWSRVSPFGNLRIKACVPLPEAYRSLLRPSSPDDAKAFTVGCNWFYANATLGVYFTHLQKKLLTLNFQRTKVFASPLVSHPRGIPPRGCLFTHCQAGQPSATRRVRMVGPDGFEPSTPRLSSACSNQLSYEPEIGNEETQ